MNTYEKRLRKKRRKIANNSKRMGMVDQDIGNDGHV